MAVSTRGEVPFDLKSTSLAGLALVLRTAELVTLRAAMTERFGADPSVFGHEPVVIDLSLLPPESAELDFDALLTLLATHRLRAAGVRGAGGATLEAASRAGLADLGDEIGAPGSPARARAAPVSEPAPVVTETLAVVTAATAPVTATLVVDKPLRSGQQVYARGGDLVVLATVNVGAEVIADGNIHVYGPLRGKAVAGAKGNADARIFSTCMEPQLLAIAGTYRTTETPLPPEVLGKPAQIRLDGERLVFEALD